MKRKFKALQIGGEDLGWLFEHKENIDWDYFDIALFDFESDYIEAIQSLIQDKGKFDLVFVQVPYSKGLVEIFQLISSPYNTYVDALFWGKNFEVDKIVKNKMIRPLNYKTQEALHDKLKAVTFSGQYGDKLYPKHIVVNKKFNGEIKNNGNKYIVLNGDFGNAYTPIASWKNNVVCDKNKVTQVWPEFKTEGNVEIEYTFRLIKEGTIDTIDEEIVLTQEDLSKPLEITSRPYSVYASVSMRARGKGKIYIGAIHKRWSRLDMGQFIFGGERYVDENREEFFYYFNPGDMQPPLNVYFSGYRSLEGFEGYFMMYNLNAPFLLISDPRIEGGAFYLGSESYEQAIKEVIFEKLRFLGFSEDELILSGLSMGSFGALYYGAQLNPSGIIIGKPLVNIGTIAENMRLLRPEDFGTALDVLMAHEHSMSGKDVKHLNEKFWKVIVNSNMKDTTFAIAYMEHDDYDTHAFKELLPLLSKQQARVMSRAVPGRHNDDSPTITNWFVNFYHIILETKFGRVKYGSK